MGWTREQANRPVGNDAGDEIRAVSARQCVTLRADLTVCIVMAYLSNE
jgi:hypothetical protein